MGSIKDRNGMDLTEADDIKKRWQEYWSGLPLPSPKQEYINANHTLRVMKAMKKKMTVTGKAEHVR